jgi:hypothetical protein
MALSNGRSVASIGMRRAVSDFLGVALHVTRGRAIAIVDTLPIDAAMQLEDVWKLILSREADDGYETRET